MTADAEEALKAQIAALLQQHRGSSVVGTAAPGTSDSIDATMPQHQTDTEKERKGEELVLSLFKKSEKAESVWERPKTEEEMRAFADDLLTIQLKAREQAAIEQASLEEAIAEAMAESSAVKTNKSKNYRSDAQRAAAERNQKFKAQAGRLTPELKRVLDVLRDMRGNKALRTVLDYAAAELDKQKDADVSILHTQRPFACNTAFRLTCFESQSVVRELLQIEQSWKENNIEWMRRLEDFLGRSGIVPIGVLDADA